MSARNTGRQRKKTECLEQQGDALSRVTCTIQWPGTLKKRKWANPQANPVPADPLLIRQRAVDIYEKIYEQVKKFPCRSRPPIRNGTGNPRKTSSFEQNPLTLNQTNNHRNILPLPGRRLPPAAVPFAFDLAGLPADSVRISPVSPCGGIVAGG